jgi:hypothetical protein
MVNEQLNDEVPNAELVEKLAVEFREKFFGLTEADGSGKAVGVKEAWEAVAKLAIQRLYPVAQTSELPNDAKHGSLGAPVSAEEGKETPIGGVQVTDADK